jgi:hypothetical protein
MFINRMSLEHITTRLIYQIFYKTGQQAMMRNTQTIVSIPL